MYGDEKNIRWKTEGKTLEELRLAVTIDGERPPKFSLVLKCLTYDVFLLSLPKCVRHIGYVADCNGRRVMYERIGFILSLIRALPTREGALVCASRRCHALY